MNFPSGILYQPTLPFPPLLRSWSLLNDRGDGCDKLPVLLISLAFFCASTLSRSVSAMTYEDISQSVASATSFLPTGCLVSSSGFHLEEAMSSIELMEPKMDPGCGLLEKASHYSRLRETVLSDPLTVEGETRVADLLIGEILHWLSGTLYIQSVHSCLFMVDRNKLLNRDLGIFCEEVLKSCTVIRQFVMTSGVADEEDFIGYMFGFNDEVRSESVLAPKLDVSERLSLRLEFLSGISNLLQSSNDQDSAKMRKNLDVISSLLESILGDIIRSPNLCEEEESLILSSVDRSLHRNVLPPGPPRVVRAPLSSCEIYGEWKSVVNALKESLETLGSTQTSVAHLISRMTQVRKNSLFSSAFVRAVLYHRFSATIDVHEMVVAWLTACSGNAPLPCGKSSDPTFVTDLVSLVNRLIFTLFRSPCRQHRSLKSVLQDLSVMQDRAWAIASSIKGPKGGYPKGLWSFVALIGCIVLQLNLSLSIELDLVDLGTHESSVVLFLLQEVSGVKLLILNEMLGSLRSLRIDPDIVNKLRYQTIVAAIEKSFSSAGFAACQTSITNEIDETDLERIFELRSIPLRAFPLVKTVSFEDCLEKIKDGGSLSPSTSDECLQWVERGVELFGGSIESPLLGGDVSFVKKTVLNNKLMSLKKAEKSAHLELKYHPIVPCIVL